MFLVNYSLQSNDKTIVVEPSFVFRPFCSNPKYFFQIILISILVIIRLGPTSTCHHHQITCTPMLFPHHQHRHLPHQELIMILLRKHSRADNHRFSNTGMGKNQQCYLYPYVQLVVLLGVKEEEGIVLETLLKQCQMTLLLRLTRMNVSLQGTLSNTCLRLILYLSNLFQVNFREMK